LTVMPDSLGLAIDQGSDRNQDEKARVKRDWNGLMRHKQHRGRNHSTKRGIEELSGLNRFNCASDSNEIQWMQSCM
jgi:hypothetical protein